MSLPEPKWLTIGSLARRWKTDEEHIEQLIESGVLHAKGEHGHGKPELVADEKIERIERNRCNSLNEHLIHPKIMFPWHLGSRIIIPIEEVKRVEKELHLPNPDIKSLLEKLRAENKPYDQIVYELREKGYTNNEVGVAFGGIYREGSNALAQKYSKIYNNYKKRKLGG
jgi:hypothetical protein